MCVCVRVCVPVRVRVLERERVCASRYIVTSGRSLCVVITKHGIQY